MWVQLAASAARACLQQQVQELLQAQQRLKLCPEAGCLGRYGEAGLKGTGGAWLEVLQVARHSRHDGRSRSCYMLSSRRRS